MLRYAAALVARWRVRCLHNRVYSGILRDRTLGVTLRTRINLRRCVTCSAVIDATDVSPRNDLHKVELGDVSYLDEALVEKEDVWRMEGRSERLSLPLHHTLIASTGITVTTDIDAEFIITQQELLTAGAEYADRPASFESFGNRAPFRIVPMRYGITLEVSKAHDLEALLTKYNDFEAEEIDVVCV